MEENPSDRGCDLGWAHLPVDKTGCVRWHWLPWDSSLFPGTWKGVVLHVTRNKLQKACRTRLGEGCGVVRRGWDGKCRLLLTVWI